jgi:pimeloyl-ACP methyl ester carboxylesterase
MISGRSPGQSGMPQDTSTQTRTLGDGPTALTYDVHGDLADATAERPPLLLIGSPMDASGFGTLAGHFTDRPVITYDPRGSGRNPTDTAPITVAEHADDVHRVITAVGAGPVDVFASSGGAVNILAMVESHPDDVRRVVAHEPPTAMPLPDRDIAMAVTRDMVTTYQQSGSPAAMAKFISLIMVEGELPADYLDRPAPDPVAFGMPAEDDGSRTDPLMRNMPACQEYAPDVEALRVLGDRLIVAVGVESGQQLAARAGRAVAEVVGIPVTEFPSDHGGFLGGEFGQHGDPHAFAARLREVLG